MSRAMNHWVRKRNRLSGYARQAQIMNRVIGVVGLLMIAAIIGLVIKFWR